MTVYTVTFFTSDSDRRRAISRRIEQFSEYCRLHPFTYWIHFDGLATDILKELQPYTDADDTCLVSAFSEDWDGIWSEAANDWLMEFVDELPDSVEDDDEDV